MKTIYQLKHKGEVKYQGTERSCYFSLQQRQSNSATWAIKNGGWEVVPVEVSEAVYNEVMKNDRWAYVDAKLAEGLTFFGSTRLVKILLQDGTEAYADKNAILYKSMDKGSSIEVMQGYITSI